MKKYTKESVYLLKSLVDLREVIFDEFGKRLVSGNLYEMPCPFHEEKIGENNLVVSKDRYCCLECGACGDAVEFLMTNNKMIFIDAIEFLAKKTGVELGEDKLFGNARWKLEELKANKKIKKDVFEKIEKLLKELIE